MWRARQQRLGVLRGVALPGAEPLMTDNQVPLIENVGAGSREAT